MLITVTQSCCPADGEEETAPYFSSATTGGRSFVTRSHATRGRTDEGGHLCGGPSHGVDHVRLRPGVQHHPRDVGLTCSDGGVTTNTHGEAFFYVFGLPSCCRGDELRPDRPANISAVYPCSCWLQFTSAPCCSSSLHMSAFPL